MKFDSVIADVKSLDDAIEVGERIFDATTTDPEQVTGGAHRWHDSEKAVLQTLVARVARESVAGSSPVARMKEILLLGATKFEKPLNAEERSLLSGREDDCLNPTMFNMVSRRLDKLN
ncbi:MAG TPA: hypothetical protein PKZ32_22010 [Candidatus Melainabacteria bacterium]|nr:hypothetical protein [Candidatus Melainabacteria bacterium]